MIAYTDLSPFADRCIGRRSDFALQQQDGRYRRVGRPVTLLDLGDHLNGRSTMGTYVMDEAGRCRFAVYDADRPDGLETLADLQATLADEGIRAYLEQSRRGGHLWVFLSSAVPASLLRSWLLPFCPVGVEFYPKQKEGGGYGSLIRLPLGVHRLSGQRYPFVQWQGGELVPVAASVAESVCWLAQAMCVSVPAGVLSAVPASTTSREQPPHTSITRPQPRVLAPPSITEWCARQDPLTLIGRYVRLNQAGVGCCPFGEHHAGGKDTHPSFRVYAPAFSGGCCWYCYTWGYGGNVFNFLARYHHLDAKTLWARILAGEVF